MQENFYQKKYTDASQNRQQEIDALEKRLAELKNDASQQMGGQAVPPMPQQIVPPQPSQQNWQQPNQVQQRVMQGGTPQANQMPPQAQVNQVPPQQMNPAQPQQMRQPVNQQVQPQVNAAQQRMQQMPPQPQVNQVPPQQMYQAQQRMQQPVPPQAQMNQAPRQMGQQVRQPQMQQQQWQQWNSAGQQTRTGEKDVEKTIGKTVMGICASVLIFISFILFAALVVPFLNDTIKMILMYGVSAVITLVGGLLLMRDKENKAFIALTGCGIGAIYISTFLSAFYFDVISDIGLYICLFFWAVFVSVLSRLRSNVFLIIGQIGINLSVMIGVSACNEIEDANELLFVACYSLIAQLVFYISHFRKEYKENLINQIGWAVGATAVLFGGMVQYAREDFVGVCISILVVLAGLIPIVPSLTIHHVDEKQNASFGVFNSIYLWVAYFMCWERSEDTIAFVLIPIVLLLLLVLLEIRIPQMNHAGKVIMQCTLFFMLDASLMAIEPLVKYVTIAPLAMGCFIYGFCRKNTVYKIAGLGYSILFLLCELGHGPKAVWGILLAVCVAVLWASHRQQYRTWMKAVGYLMLLYILVRDLAFIGDEVWDIGQWRAILVVAILAVMNVIVSKIPALYHDLKTGEEEREFRIETGVIQIALILGSYTLMVVMKDLGTTVIAILLGAFVTFTNSYSLIKRDENGWMSIYVAVKAVLFAFFALASLEAASIVTSVVGLLIAFVCVVVGFAAGMQTGRSFKQIRIFGLIMVLICLLKLILVDLPFDSTLLRAISFFISGVLCFAISLIYNMVDKHLMKNGNRG